MGLFNELKIALVLWSVFLDFTAEHPTVPDTERSRIAFFARWDALHEDVRAAVALGVLLKSPACAETREVLAWKRLCHLKELHETVAARLN